jgi:hypothetical protein
MFAAPVADTRAFETMLVPGAGEFVLQTDGAYTNARAYKPETLYDVTLEELADALPDGHFYTTYIPEIFTQDTDAVASFYAKTLALTSAHVGDLSAAPLQTETNGTGEYKLYKYAEDSEDCVLVDLLTRTYKDPTDSENEVMVTFSHMLMAAPPLALRDEQRNRLAQGAKSVEIEAVSSDAFDVAYIVKYTENKENYTDFYLYDFHGYKKLEPPVARLAFPKRGETFSAETLASFVQSATYLQFSIKFQYRPQSIDAAGYAPPYDLTRAELEKMIAGIRVK